VKKVDLNVDIGEGFIHDEALLEFATSANVCCGEHAGNWELTLLTIERCRSHQTRIGIHPGFPDRPSMGRKVPEEIPAEWLESVESQASRFVSTCKAAYLKPHGAWYNVLAGLPDNAIDVESGGDCARVLFRLQRHLRLPVMMLPVGGAYAGVEDNGGTVISEGFADRAYRPDGTLAPRTEPGAVLENPEQIQRQVLRLASIVDSICLHGDTQNCLEFAELVKRTLVDNGYEVGY